MMAPDSIISIPVSRSRMAGILLLGESFRNAGSNCSSSPILMACAS